MIQEKREKRRKRNGDIRLVLHIQSMYRNNSLIKRVVTVQLVKLQLTDGCRWLSVVVLMYPFAQ